ncbi:MAG: hypothetical protein Tsb0015_15550 [Simkaniaceae bacterium]
MKQPVYLGLGSNLGDSKQLLLSACEKIRKVPTVEHIKASSIYLTTPVSDIPQPDYCNMALSFYAKLPPLELFSALQQIERDLGKKPKEKNQPRKIDIDMLYYGHMTLQTKELILPHPEILHRLFVLKPLQELTNELPNISNLNNYMNNFPNIHQEKVEKVYEPYRFAAI